MEKRWVVVPRIVDDVVGQILHNRNVGPEAHADFLQPDWDRGTHSPWLFTKMRQAVDRVFTSFENNEPIVIHGDYDADGVSGSALLFTALRKIVSTLPADRGGSYDLNRLSVYLPDREKDGYGVAMHTIDRIAGEGAKLLITVDCGIACAPEFARAADHGVDVIVCDHHQLGDELPNRALLLHPLVPGETYPNKTLCGTGVAFKFASALFDEARARGATVPEGYERWLLDLVAIATVTDVMPLTGENRVLEHFGLSVLKKSRRPGLLAILQSAGTSPEVLDTSMIGFRIGPRLNAAGRLASAEIAFRTLVAESPAEAMLRATELEELNKKRQTIFAASYKEASVQAREQTTAPVFVVWSDAWLPGIVGLIAGRLASDYGRPAFAFARVGAKYVGSGRSAGGLHLVEAMNACGEIFLKRGGHPQACGLSIVDEDGVKLFRDRVGEHAQTIFGSELPVPQITIDVEMPLVGANMALLDQLVRLAPFGEGNAEPMFLSRNVELCATEAVGSTANHLRLNVFDEERNLRKMIGFSLGSRASEFSLGDRVDIVYAIGENVWNGRRELQCRVVDVKRASGIGA